MRIKPIYFILILLLVGCGPAVKITPQFDLSGYAGRWFGADYDWSIDERGDTVRTGSSLVVDPDTKSIGIECYGPPPMSRIASFSAPVEVSVSGEAVFRFDDDGWGNSGSGSIAFRKGEILAEIKIERFANADMQIFEGGFSFTR